MTKSYTIDAISTDKRTGRVNITLIDHLKWDEYHTDSHRQVLEDKLNACAEFIESGELIEVYPRAQDREVAIRVVGRHPRNEHAEEFFEYAREALQEVRIALEFQHLTSEE